MVDSKFKALNQDKITVELSSSLLNFSKLNSKVNMKKFQNHNYYGHLNKNSYIFEVKRIIKLLFIINKKSLKYN